MTIDPAEHLALVDLVHLGEGLGDALGERAPQQLEAELRVVALALVELLGLLGTALCELLDRQRRGKGPSLPLSTIAFLLGA